MKREQIRITNYLGQFLQEADESVNNVTPDFLAIPGQLGLLNVKTNEIERVQNYALEQSWCTPAAFRHLEETAAFLNRREFTKGNTPESILAALNRSGATPQSARYCWMHSSLVGKDFSYIIKYDYARLGFWRALLNYSLPYALWILLIHTIALNFYYRGIVFVVVGPKRTGQPGLDA